MKKLFMITGSLFLMLLPVSAMRIEYSGSLNQCIDENELVIDESELVVPGDSISEEVHFENTLNRSVGLSLVLNNKEENDIYELKVYKDDELLADIDDLNTTDAIDLGKFNQDESCDLRFELSIPTSIDNDYTFESEELVWQLVTTQEDLPNTGIYSSSAYLIVGISLLAVAYLIERGGKKNEKA